MSALPSAPARSRTLEPDTDNGLYQTLLESTLAIPFRIDWATQRYTYIGPQIEALLGWTPESWETVQDWADRIHPDEREQTVGRCVELCLAGVDHEADYRALTRDGRFVWVREVIHVLCDAQGRTTGLIGFTFDISERKKTEQLLEQQRLVNARLQERLNLTQDLHDGLGGTLVHMIASLEQDRDAVSPAKALSMLKLIRNDLRQTLDSQASAQVRVPASLAEWLAPLRHRFVNLFDELKMACDWRYPAQWRTPPQAVHCLALTRLIEEALTNVIKHSQAQRVSLCFEQPEPDVLTLEIEDDGVGFDVSAVNASGLGIGMRSMSMRIARAGGTLAIDARPGRTALTARLPLGQSQAQA